LFRQRNFFEFNGWESHVFLIGFGAKKSPE